MNIEFQLKAELKCSGSLSAAVSSSDLTEFVNYCNEGVLKKVHPPVAVRKLSGGTLPGKKLG